MHFVDLSASNLKYARLTAAHLSAVDLRGSDLNLIDLSGARIQPGRMLKPDGEIDDEEVFCMLTQAQMDEAAADPAKPPEIHSGTLDAETGERLVWNNERGGQNWRRLHAQKQSGAASPLGSMRVAADRSAVKDASQSRSARRRPSKVATKQAIHYHKYYRQSQALTLRHFLHYLSRFRVPGRATTVARPCRLNSGGSDGLHPQLEPPRGRARPCRERVMRGRSRCRGRFRQARLTCARQSVGDRARPVDPRAGCAAQVDVGRCSSG